MVEVSEVKPGDVGMEGVANVGHVLLCDHACKVVYKWGEEEGSDVCTSGWWVEKEGICECDEVTMDEVQSRGEWGCFFLQKISLI